MARYDDINAPAVLYATALSCVVLFAVIQGIQALTCNWENRAQEYALSNSEYRSSKKTIDEQLKSVNDYKWVNVPGLDEKAPPEKRLQIPIGRAQEVVIEEMKTVGT
jgi:hypothetical protein